VTVLTTKDSREILHSARKSGSVQDDFC